MMLLRRKVAVPEASTVPAIGLSLSSTALTVTQNGTVTATVFGTRTGGFTDDATLSVEGLAPGASWSFSPNPLTGTNEVATLTITANANAALVTNDAFTVVLTSSLGVQSVAATLTITTAAQTGEPPIVQAVSPSSGAPDTTRAVTITGQRFLAGATVEVGNGSTWTAATGVTVVSLTSITCTIPALALGSYAVRVTTTNGVGQLLNAVSYGAVPFFTESFANGQFNNANGFAWLSPRKTDVSSLRSRSGTHSLRFRFDAGPTNQSTWAEQRFDMGRYLEEVAVEYYLWMPDPLPMRVVSPDNNKFFMLWRDQAEYGSGNGAWQVGMEYTFPNAQDGAATIADARMLSSRWDNNFVTSSGTWGPAPAAVRPPLIGGTGPFVLGAWNRVRFFAKAASNRTAENGILRCWINDTVVFNYTQGRFHNFFPDNGAALLRTGYILGYPNTGFSTEIECFADDFSFFTSQPPEWTV